MGTVTVPIKIEYLEYKEFNYSQPDLIVGIAMLVQWSEHKAPMTTHGKDIM